MQCVHNRQTYRKGQWVCRECGGIKNTTGRRPLTDHEKLKLSWYRDERKWIDNIKSRQIVTDNHGKKHIIVPGYGELPTQPRALWQKPRGRE